MPGGLLIRRATVADADSVVAVHMRAWRETYAGLVPDEVIRGAPVARRVAAWTKLLSDPYVDTFVVAASETVAFASCGAARDPRLGAAGEITAVYVLAAQQRRGFGRALMRACAEALSARGHDSCGLWVLDSNAPARRFYAALGGEAGFTKEETRGSVVLVERAYTWPRTAMLT